VVNVKDDRDVPIELILHPPVDSNLPRYVCRVNLKREIDEAEARKTNSYCMTAFQ
jgi:hypothetical protein